MFAWEKTDLNCGYERRQSTTTCGPSFRANCKQFEEEVNCVVKRDVLNLMRAAVQCELYTNKDADDALQPVKMVMAGIVKNMLENSLLPGSFQEDYEACLNDQHKKTVSTRIVKGIR